MVCNLAALSCYAYVLFILTRTIRGIILCVIVCGLCFFYDLRQCGTCSRMSSKDWDIGPTAIHAL